MTPPCEQVSFDPGYRVSFVSTPGITFVSNDPAYMVLFERPHLVGFVSFDPHYAFRFVRGDTCFSFMTNVIANAIGNRISVAHTYTSGCMYLTTRTLLMSVGKALL